MYKAVHTKAVHNSTKKTIRKPNMQMKKNLLWSLTLLSKRSVHFVVSQNVSVKASEQLS